MAHADKEIFPTAASVDYVRTASVKGSAATVAAQIPKTIVQFCTQLILARFLFPADFGLIAMVAPILNLIQIINDLGFGQVLVQRPKIYEAQTSTLFWLNFVFSIGVAGVLLASSPLIAWIYSEPRTVPLVIAMAPLIPIGTLGIFPNALLNRQLKFVTLATVDVAAVLVGSASTIFLAWLWSNYWALVVGYIVLTICTVAPTWVLCGWRPSRPSQITTVWNDLVFGRNVTATNLANFASISGANMLIGAVAGSVALGLYDRSYRLVVQPLTLILLPLGRVAIPLLSRLRATPEQYSKVYLMMVQLILLATTPLMSVCIADGASVVKILLGARWEVAGPIFSWLCVGGLAAGLFISFWWLFVSQDRTGPLFRYTLAASIINVLSFGIGIFWGAIGVAAMSGVSYLCIQTPLVMYGATRSGPVSCVKLVRAILPICIAGLLAFSAVWFRPPLTAIGTFGGVLLDLLLPMGSWQE